MEAARTVAATHLCPHAPGEVGKEGLVVDLGGGESGGDEATAAAKHQCLCAPGEGGKGRGWRWI